MTDHQEQGAGDSSASPQQGTAERLRLLETQVQTLAQAVRALAQAQEGAPHREPDDTQATRGARLAHELLLAQGL